jgi:hypothetical protein
MPLGNQLYAFFTLFFRCEKEAQFTLYARPCKGRKRKNYCASENALFTETSRNQHHKKKGAPNMKDIIMYGRNEPPGEEEAPPQYPTTIVMQEYCEQSVEAKERQRFIEHLCAMFEELDRAGIQPWRVDPRTLSELSELSIDEFKLKLHKAHIELGQLEDLLDEVGMLHDDDA